MAKSQTLVVEDEKDIREVIYTAVGKAPYHQGQALYLKDAAGEHVAAKNYDIRRDAAHPQEFTKVFPLLDLSKEYYACTSRFEDEEFPGNCQFTIELK